MSFKETDLGLIPEEWKVDSLKNSLYIKGRIGWKGLKKSEYLKESNFRIINGSSITNDNKIDWENCGFISEERYLESPEIMLKENDIVMTKDGTIGKLAIIKNLPGPTTIASGLFLIRVEDPSIDVNYLFYYFRSHFFRDLIHSRIEGSVIPHLYQRDLVNLKLPLPNINEQKAIARILSTLDEKIETNNQINEKLEEMAQALFKHWFVDFEFPNENGEPYKSSGGEMVDSELGMIPKGWEVKTINDISSEIITGKTPSTKEKENFGGNIPFVKIPDMHGKVYVEKTETYLSEKGAVKNKIVPKNSIMVSCIATPGIVSLAGQSCQTNQQINTIINKDNKMCYFNFFSLRNLSDTIRTLGSSGSATLNLNKNQFSKIKIVVPPKEMTDKYFNVVDKIFETIYLNQKENLKLIELRDNLLPKLMSGEIRVPLDNETVVDQS